MPMVVRVKVGTKQVQADLQFFYDKVQDKEGFLQVVGRRGAEVLRDWFRRLDSSHPNKQNWPRQHFWRGVRDSVQAPSVHASLGVAVIAINHPVIAHKAGVGPAGGRIVPKLKKWLTIPVISEAYGKSAKEYEEGGAAAHKLFFIRRDEKTAFLMEISITRTEFDDPNDTSKSRNTEKSLKLVYVLKKEVMQRPEPDALPGEERWTMELMAVASRFYSREQSRGD